MCAVGYRDRKRIFSPEAGVIGSGEPPDVGVENPAVVQEEQQVLLTIEPSL